MRNPHLDRKLHRITFLLVNKIQLSYYFRSINIRPIGIPVGWVCYDTTFGIPVVPSYHYIIICFEGNEKHIVKTDRDIIIESEIMVLNSTFLGRGAVVWIQAFALAKQVLYCLRHTSSPFWSGYFGDEVLRSILLGLASVLCLANLSLPSA
jgi:hypothetical protein